MRNLFVPLLILSSLLTSAQIKQGAKVVDLSFAFSDVKSTANTSFFFVQPLIGIATKENQVVYAGLRYENQKLEFTFTEKKQIASLVLGVEKFLELAPKIYFAPFLSGSVGIGNVESTNPDSTNDLKRFSFSLRPRLHYFINNKWSLVASIGAIEYAKEIQDDNFINASQESFSANLNSTNVFFGMRLNLNNE